VFHVTKSGNLEDARGREDVDVAGVETSADDMAVEEDAEDRDEEEPEVAEALGGGSVEPRAADFEEEEAAAALV
jgi:hypothetical protein